MPITRSRVIQMYLAAVAVAAVVYTGLGPALAVGSSLLVIALLLVPAVIVYRVWPDTPDDTAMEIMRRR